MSLEQQWIRSCKCPNNRKTAPKGKIILKGVYLPHLDYALTAALRVPHPSQLRLLELSLPHTLGWNLPTAPTLAVTTIAGSLSVRALRAAIYFDEVNEA